MYTITLMDDVEFDRLPYRYAKEAIGLANPKTNHVFVRKTGVKEMDMATISHEIDELAAKISPHEEDGIRYKKVWKEAIAPILYPVLGTMIGGPIGGALGGTGGAIAGGALGAAGGSAGAQAAQGQQVSLLPTLLSAAGGAFGGPGASAGYQAAEPGILSRAAGTIKGTFGLGNIPSSASTVAGFGGQNIPYSQTLQGAGGSFTPSGVNIPGGNIFSNIGWTSPISQATGQAAQKKWTDYLPLATSLLGLLGTGTPKLPEMPSYQLPTEQIQQSLADYQALQYQDFLKQIRPIAATQGWLDSTTYANLISDYLQRQNVASSMNLSDLLSQQALQNYNTQQLLYQYGLGQYSQDIASRDALKSALLSEAMNAVRPGPYYWYTQ